MRSLLSQQRWTTVETLFVAAAGLPPEERRRFLDTECGEDTELREEVLSLLRYDTGVPEVEAAVGESARSLLASESLEGTMLGPWRVERELGRGGMSEVYLAVRADGQFSKRVAIKIIKRGMDTAAVIERFHQERRILAALDHPYISRLLDGGTTPRGLPYIVMEYVEGLPVDRWCDERSQSVEQRCEIICKVCEAVAYAHRNLVIHRDLKPGNILVGEDGNPRLLDFGIAKLLGDGAESGGAETRVPLRPFTPEYASPEQVTGTAVGTTTDVYSFGVVLFELLAGARPTGDNRASAAALRNGKDPRWARRVAGDLDTILEMALRPEPERRYLGVEQLRADLQLHLSGMPVAARREKALYRWGKFVRRHRTAVFGAAAVMLALAGGIVVSTREAEKAQTAGKAALRASARATTERDRALDAEKTAGAERNAAVAERERATAEAATAKAVTDFLRDDLLGQASPNAQAGKDLTVRTALDRAAARIEGKFAGKPVVEADIRNTIGESYDALGLYPEAQQQYQRAWELRRGALGENDRDTLDALTSIAVIDRQQGKLDEAERLYNKILTAQRAEFGTRDSGTLLTMSNLAVVYSHQEKFVQSAALSREALAIQREILGPEHLDTLRTMNNLGVAYTKLGRFADSERIYSQILEIRKRVQGPEHPNTIFTANNLAVVYSRPGGNPAAAEKLYRETLDIQRRILGPDHPDTLLTMDNLGLLWTHLPDRYPAAEQMLKEVVGLRQRVLGPAHLDTLSTRVSLGMVEILQKKYGEAESELRGACDAFVEAKLQAWQRYSCESMLGASLVSQNRLAEAEPILLTGYQGLKARETSIPALWNTVLPHAAGWLSRLYLEEGKPELAAQWKATSTELEHAAGLR